MKKIKGKKKREDKKTLPENLLCQLFYTTQEQSSVQIGHCTGSIRYLKLNTKMGNAETLIRSLKLQKGVNPE